MTYTIGDRVNRIEQRDSVGATVVSTLEVTDSALLLELAYDEGATGWWPADCVELAET